MLITLGQFCRLCDGDGSRTPHRPARAGRETPRAPHLTAEAAARQAACGTAISGRLLVGYRLTALRHGYASLLISCGLDVVFVSRQLRVRRTRTSGSVSTPTLYARREQKRRAMALEASYASTAGTAIT
jgi:hypothetical protein